MSGSPHLLFRLHGLLLVAILLVAGVASAQSEEDIASARALFERAEVLREQGEHALAAEKLRLAIAIKETPGLRFHLAHALEQDGRLLAARREYERARWLVEQGHPAEDVRRLLGPALARLDEQTPTVEVRLPAHVSEAVVTIDGTKVRAGAKHPIDPGRRTIAVRAPERQPVTVVLVVAPRERRLVEPGIAPAPEAAEAPSPGFPLREVVLASEAGLVAVALGFGILQTVAAANASDEAARQQATLERIDPDRTDTCLRLDPRPQACSDLQGAVDDHEQASRLAMLGYAVAGTATLSFVGTLLLWPARSPEAGAGAHRRVGAGTRLGASHLPGGMFAAFARDF